MKFSRTRNLILAIALGLAGYGPATAQNLFEPVIRVNDDEITLFEIQQRELFLQVLGVPGNHAELARTGLIEDRLRMQAIRSAGLEATQEGIEAGMEEFAGRANLTIEEFLTQISEVGIEEETFRDFVSVGVVWRDLLRIRFGRLVQVSEAEIDRAMQATQTTGLSVLISELIMPVNEQQTQQILELAENLSQITSVDEFSNAAQLYSATATRDQGGKLDWMPLSQLPPALGPQLLALAPGEVTSPIPIQNAVALFQLRGIRETSLPAKRYAAVEYAIFYIAGGKSPEALAKAEKLKAQVDVCDDLYGTAYGLPDTVLKRESLPPSEVPTDIALELAKLDEGEVSTALTTADQQTLLFLMLCGRTSELNEDASREDITNALRQQRINAFSQSYIDQLLADARILEK